jgi:hypothetical protein
MFGVGKLTAAIDNLASAIDCFARTIGQVDSGVRQRLRLDPADEASDVVGEIEGPERLNGRTRKGKQG